MTPPVPTVSVIIPTRNEEGVIGPLLSALCAEPVREIIVVDGDSTDRSAEISSRCATVLRVRPGRGTQLNAGANAATGDVLLFLHADVRLETGALQRLREVMANPVLIGGTFDIRFEGEDFAAQAFTRINRVRRLFGVFYGDAGVFCRRAVFESLGGYRPWPILEDYEFARRLWKAGQLALLDEPIWVSARRWRKSGLMPTLWQWFWIQVLYFAGVSPHRLARMYRDIR